jgi:hypothetical protein
MEEFVPPIIEVVPKVQGFRCKTIIACLYSLITFTPLVVGVWIGYAYNVWAGIAFFLFLTLVGGVVSSKMRVASIPYEQREMNYSTMAIVKWYVAKNICLEKM